MKPVFPMSRASRSGYRATGRAALAAVALALAAPVAPALAQEGAFPAPDDFSEMVEARLPAVVGVLSTTPAPAAPAGPLPQLPPGMEDFFGAPRPQPRGPLQSQGSGFVISADGLVVTNNHVIAGSERIEVVLSDGRRLDAALVGADPATDIALLQAEGAGDIPSVEWGSSDDLAIGDWVVAIGNPFGLGGTVTAGIVSARSRDIRSGPYDDFIQTDAAINRGNSGGPLFDTNGEVVGVNTAIFSPTGGNVGIGFAVPSAVAQRIVSDLREDGEVERGWLGVQIQTLDGVLAGALGLDDEARGVLIADVTAGGPAAEAGLEPGDVVVEIAGMPVDGPRALTFAVADLPVGEPVEVAYLRDGARQRAEVVIGERPDMRQASAMPGEDDGPEPAGGPRIGVSVAPLTAELRAQLGIPGEVSGLVVQSVEPGGPAAGAGIRGGDVIVEAAGSQVESVETLREAIAEAAKDGGTLLVRVFRQGSFAFLGVTLDAQGTTSN
jgi:serine protease Do